MKLIHKATIINEGEKYTGSVLIEGERILKIFRDDVPESIEEKCSHIYDARGLFLMPGVIDDQVHFREPGLTHKGDIHSESRAAVAGGVTSFMDMPNTQPQTIDEQRLEEKFEIAAQQSIANYSFYIGATNNNIKDLLKIDFKNVCGVKIFMGSSTGNMLVDDTHTLEQIFAEVDALIATHCEKEEIIRKNLAHYKKQFGDNIPVSFHPLIRNDEACYRSSAEAIELADKYGTRLHVLHLSTAREMKLFSNSPLEDKKITGEVCVHHLWFTDKDYDKSGPLIKWNPAIKAETDREALREALRIGKLDVVATDHAPHLLSEKEGGYLQAASGGPLVQHSLQAMLELTVQDIYTKTFVVDKMCHAPAKLFGIKDRGFIREGYYADLVLVNPGKFHTVHKDNIFYKCGWSPFENTTFSLSIDKTFVNGNLVFNDGEILEGAKGQALAFAR